MEKFDSEKILRRSDYLPQSEVEWLETGKFQVEMVTINDRQIRCALARGLENEPLTVMAGGIPRDQERREKLPLINKLYGHLAIKMLDQNKSSLLYNQPSTGGSSGEWEKETLLSRSDALVGVTEYFYRGVSASDVTLIGTSAAGYMTVNALEQLQDRGVKVLKLVLLSPAAYPEEVENIPYGEMFTELIRRQWNVAESPVFPRLERYVKDGGALFISFFEADDPPIPRHIQEYYKTFARRLSEEGGDVTLMTIPGVTHNFRRINSQESKNIVDNDSIRSTTAMLVNFLIENKNEQTEISG